MSPQEKTETESGDDEILRVAKERFSQAVDAESDIRSQALEDLKFGAGEQWDPEVRKAREDDRRPCLTFNRLPQFIRQITNDQKQNRPAIKVSPVDDRADVETAKIYQGLIRHIEYSSDADVAYDTGFSSAVRGGFGYWRVVTEYCDPYSFDQELRIKRIKNPFSVYLDPSYQQPDGSDAQWGFVFEDLSKEDFKARYPGVDVESMETFASEGHDTEWLSEDRIRVAEYFYIEQKEITLVQLNNDAQTITDKALLKMDELEPGVEIVTERKSLVPIVNWCKITGTDVLEKTIWPGKHIPIIPVLGEELDINGKRVLESLIRHSLDSQRMLNFHKTNEAETIALAPRAPWIVGEGQLEGHEEAWRTANSRNHAFLQYKPTSHAGVPLPPPQRNSFEPPVMAITNASMQAADDLKATTGIYDAALGARSNEQSGIAIQRRNIQAQTSNFHFVDNLAKSIRHTGRILVDVIPKIYDTARAVRILGEEGDEEVVRINEQFKRNGKPVSYNLGAGKYDVTISTGPSFETKRQEAVASMLEISKANPQVMGAAGDLIVKSMDWPGAQEISERLKKILPPGLADDKDKEKQPIPPEVQQQLMQQSQMLEQLTGALNEANQKVQTKTLELESKERIEMAKLQAQVEMKMADLGSQEALALLAHEVAEIQGRLNQVGFHEPIGFQEPTENQSFDGAGPEGAVQPEQQQPTGGFPPGNSMGV